MTQEQHAEELAARAAQAVRQAIEEAEVHAAEIVRDAEDKAARVREEARSEAARIRERAEADARAQIDAARKALDELGGTLAAAAAAAVPAAESAPADREPETAPAPAPSEPGPAPDAPPAESPGAPEAPISPPAPEPDQVVPAGANGDDAAERLVAMKLAVDGKDRTAIEAELNDRFGAGDRSALLDDVLSRARR
jgi:hypothetical protein